jgi:hypothetical protein
MKNNGLLEKHMNNTLKTNLAFAEFLAPNMSFYDMDNRDHIISFLYLKPFAYKSGFQGTPTFIVEKNDCTDPQVLLGAIPFPTKLFFLASTLGAARVTASNFLSNYQTPLRLDSIALLIWAYNSASNSLVKNCKITFAGPNCLLS